MQEKIYSERLNPITMFTADKAKELRDEYELQYKNNYAATVRSVQAFLRSTKGECLSCNSTKYAQVTP